MSAVDKRMFYLMLSPAQGQEFASEIGFSTPSEDVQEAETLDVISRWALITATGLLEEILISADWVSELQEEDDNIREDVREAFHKTMTSFGVALVNKLLDSGKVILTMEGDSDE
jgi:hypothetical protein